MTAPAPSRPVALVPLRRCLMPLLVALVPWLVVVLGRGLCLVAQRIPPLVRLVQVTRQWHESRRADEELAASLVCTGRRRDFSLSVTAPDSGALPRHVEPGQRARSRPGG